MVHCAAIDCTNGSSKKNDESINFFKLLKDPERKKLWISKLKREKLPEEENIYVCHFHFDSSCFKRNFRVYSIFQILYFIHLCVGIEYRFCDINFFSSLQNELLGISAKKLLTENPVPTNFSYTKSTQKRKTTEIRQSCSTKRQLIDNAIQTNVEMELTDKGNLLIENSKSCQTKIAIPSLQSISTQTNASDIAMIEEKTTTL